MKHFDELGLSEQTLSAVKALGYTDPTPVQEQAIPLVRAGRDIIAAAKTGTGKTAAFSLPSMDGLGHARHGQGPLMLVVTPTRELAMQIREVCFTISKSTHHQVCCVVGGVSYDPQIKQLNRGCDVLIATPGRLIDLMQRKAVRLNQVEVLVLDEADRMLDMGFLPDMKRIVAACPENRQTLLFSATIDDGIQKNMGKLLKNPAFVEIAHKGETADKVDQYVIEVDQRAKNDLLIALLNEKGGTRIIVFCRTRHRADNTCRKLRRAGFKADPIHSDRSQNQRKRSLDSFVSGKIDILVATDVLARGIDVSDVNYVVNVDLPNVPEDYVHRIGRTGRAGADGYAVSFVTPQTRTELKNIEKLIGRKLDPMELKSFDASASEEALARKATSRAAKDDPELAQAAAQHKRDEARRKRADAQRSGQNPEGDGFSYGKGKGGSRHSQTHKTRGTAKKQDKKNQKRSEGYGGQESRGGYGDSKRGKGNKGGYGENRGGRSGGGKGGSGKGGAGRTSGTGKVNSGSGSKNGGKDFRPGRSQRAQSRSGKRS